MIIKKENEVLVIDKVAAVGGILTLGTSHWVSNIPSWYSAVRTWQENW